MVLNPIKLQIDQQCFPVLSLTGHEALSDTFLFTMTICISTEKAGLNWLLKSVQLKLPERTITGVITKYLVEYNEIEHILVLHIDIEPRLALLKRQFQAQIIYQQSIIDILKQRLTQIGYSLHQLNFSLIQFYPIKNYRLQPPEESDFDFLQRLLSQAGIFYWFSNNNNLETLNFADNNSNYEKLAQTKIDFVQHNELINHPSSFYDLQMLTQQTPTGFNIRDYNEELPNQYIKSQFGSSEIIQNYFGVGCLNDQEANHTAKFYTQAAALKSWSMCGKNISSLFKPGVCFNLDATTWCDSEQHEQNYLVIEAYYEIKPLTNFSEKIERINFTTTVRFIKKSTPFCTKPQPHPELSTLYIAHIKSNSDYPQLDDQGRYFFHQQLDLNHQKIPTNFSLRKLSPFADSPGQNGNTGIHCPLHDNTEVILSYLYGDPDRPVILGSLYNSAAVNPVTANNHQQHLMRTASSNLLCLDDSDASPEISLSTADNKNSLQFKQKILFQSQQGKIALTAKNNISLQSQENTIEYTQQNRQHNIQHSFASATQHSNMQYNANTDLKIIANQNSFINAAQNIYIKSTENMGLNTQQNSQLNIQGTHATFCAGNNLTIQATDMILISATNNGSIIITQGAAKIEMFSSGIVNLTATQITLSGQPIFSVSPIYNG